MRGGRKWRVGGELSAGVVLVCLTENEKKVGKKRVVAAARGRKARVSRGTHKGLKGGSSEAWLRCGWRGPWRDVDREGEHATLVRRKGEEETWSSYEEVWARGGIGPPDLLAWGRPARGRE
jgi:hypothetical protein